MKRLGRRGEEVKTSGDGGALGSLEVGASGFGFGTT